MHRVTRAFRIALLASALGCGSDGLEGKVSGNVTLDGKAIGPGSVAFVPADGSNPATGTVQLDGSYTLRSNRLEGVPPGHYQATVMVFNQVPVAPGERSTMAQKLVTPEKYADPATSGLEYDVQAGSQTIDIPLVSGS